MATLICGSLAFDSIATFPGRFADQILPEKLHILNVSFLVPGLRREFGGCAGNIAYNLAALGGEAVVVAAVGSDGLGYVERLRSWGVATEAVRAIDDAFTAQAFIMTDLDNNQITAFHPGAMQSAHEIDVPARSDLALAIVAPDGREAMLRHAAQLVAAGVPFIFDPGQGLPMFDGAELRRFVEQASWVAVNDYEAEMLAERTGMTLEAMSRSHLRGIVVTLGAEGCDLWQDGQRTARGRRRRARAWSIRPAAATPFAPRCSTAWSAAGRWSAAPGSATASARSRSPAAEGRIMCWIARSFRPDPAAPQVGGN